jgi:ribosomal protein L11 methyltransferase
MERLAEPDEEGSEALATSSFQDAPAGHWQVDAYYADEPSPATVLARIGDVLTPGTAPIIEDVPDENWVAVSQAALPPVEAGRFLVHGSHDRARVGRRRFGIEVDAGEAFGTAHHATTQGCLEAIDRLARRRRFTSILDLGCGSGVLAIAAARVWPAARIMASDIDPVSVAVARTNAALNGVSSSVGFVTAAGLAHGAIASKRPFDLVVANILAGPLIRLAPEVARAIRPGGFVVLSGLLGEQMREVAAVYAMAGFQLSEKRLRHNWATLVMVRSARSKGARRANGRHQGAGRFETRRNLPDWVQDQ